VAAATPAGEQGARVWQEARRVCARVSRGSGVVEQMRIWESPKVTGRDETKVGLVRRVGWGSGEAVDARRRKVNWARRPCAPLACFSFFHFLFLVFS
jgi:hypothetical protein